MNTSEAVMNLTTNRSSPGCIETYVTLELFMVFFRTANKVLLVSTILSAILQVYILHCAYKHIRGRTADKCLHVFLFSMTCADFILTGICYPIELVQKEGWIFLPYAVNLMEQLLCCSSLIASSFSLVFLNLDKLAYFRFPLRYSLYFTRRRSVWISGACWFFAVAYVVMAYLNGSFRCMDVKCMQFGMNSDDIFVYIISTLWSSILPTVTSLLVAIYILNIMSVHQKQIKQEKLLCSPSHPHGRQNSIFLTRMRTFYFIFMTTVFTAITLLPYRISSIWRILNDIDRECSSILMYWVLIFMVMLNSIINPLLTVTILPQYRLRCITQMRTSFRETDSTRESL